MNRNVALSVGFVLSSLVAPQSVYACSCLYIADDEDRAALHYKNADLILQGIPTEMHFGDDERIHYRISVEKVWKGRADARMDLETALDGAACGINLALDKRVVIFANKTEDGSYQTGLCSGTIQESDAVDLIDWLNIYDEKDVKKTSVEDEKKPVKPDCSPYVCANGDTHPKCEGDTVINYFVNPCEFSDKEVAKEKNPSDAFGDVPATHPNFTAISFVRKEGIVSGYANGTYLPSAFINRAEFTKIIVEANFSRAQIDRCADDLVFTDIAEDDWFYPYVCMAVKHSILEGYPDNTFRPANLVNFAEASKIVVNAFHIKIDSGYEGGVWWRKYVLTLAGIGGLPTTFTDPNQSLMRGDMAEIIYRVMIGKT